MRTAVGAVMVSVMHEQVHQRARQEQEIRQHAEKVSAMLGEHEEGGHRPKAHQRYGAARPPERLCFLRRDIHD
jgi:hypothetical protein